MVFAIVKFYWIYNEIEHQDAKLKKITVARIFWELKQIFLFWSFETFLVTIRLLLLAKNDI